MCLKGNLPIWLNVPETSTSSTDSQPDYFNKHGDPVYAHMVNVKEINHKKHLIQFPISVDLEKVSNSMEHSTKCPTVLLKADMGDDVNLMNSNTFDTLIQERTVLQCTSLRMEAYGNNTAVEVLGKFHAFLRWKSRVYRQLFYVTSANASPNLLSRDGCYTLGVLRPCYSVGIPSSSKEIQKQCPHSLPPTWTMPKCKVVHINIVKNEGTGEEKCSHSNKWSITKDQLQGTPFMRQDILEVYSEVFTGIRSSPVLLTNSSSSQMSNLWDMYLDMFQFTYRMLSTRKSKIWNS